MRFADTRSLAELCALHLRPIDHWADDGAGNVTPVFVPPLAPAEQSAFDDLEQMATLGLQTLTLAQYQARKADVQGLRGFLALASPTQAQALAAEKALIRVVGAMLKLDLGG